MRPLAVFLALCLTPVADACFLKCFRSSTPVETRIRLRTVEVRLIYGQPCGDPAVPSGFEGVPAEVQCNFNPVGYKPMHYLNGVEGWADHELKPEEVRELYQYDPSSGTFKTTWEFTYTSLPKLDPRTTYKLRIKVDTATSDVCVFHTN